MNSINQHMEWRGPPGAGTRSIGHFLHSLIAMALSLLLLMPTAQAQSVDWSGIRDNWRSVGGVFPAGARLSAVARTPNNLDLFITGNDGRVYTSWWFAGSDWSGINNNWRSLGGVFPAGAPVSAVARTANNLDLFITGNDGRVYTSWWFAGSDWSGINNNWRSVGGFFPAGAPVSAVARNPGQLDLFIVGNDGRVYTSWWTAGHDWSGINNNWRSIGGFFPPGSPVSVVARNPGQLDLFVIGNDGRVYTSWWTAGHEWSGINNNWRSIGGFFPLRANIGAVARTPNNLDLFITGNDGKVYTSWWFAGSDWSGINNNWRSLGGFFPAGATVSAVARTANNLDLFITGNDGRVYTSWWFAGIDWSGINNNWRSIGGFFPRGAPPVALARNPGQLDVFITGNDGRVYTSWFPCVECNPAVSLRAIQDAGRFIEVNGTGFSRNQTVKISYGIQADNAPTTTQHGNYVVSTDARGRLLHRIRVNVVGPMSAHIKATDQFIQGAAEGSIRN